MVKKNNIDLLVVSCDSYSDVWPYFFNNFFINWSDCPINIFLLSNFKTFKDSRINNISIGKDISWSGNLLKGLSKIDSDYVIIMIDDLLLNRKISNNYFFKITKWIKHNNPNYLRLHNSTRTQNHDKLIGKIPIKTPYKVSLMPGIWNKKFLEKILKKGENAWEFEKFGSKRAYYEKNFFSLHKNFFFYDNAIIKGKWQKHIALKYNVAFHSRSPMSDFDQLIYNLKIFRSKIFNLLPNNIRMILKG